MCLDVEQAIVQFPALRMRKHWLLILQVALSVFLLWRIFGHPALRQEASRVFGEADLVWLLGGLFTALLTEFLCAVRWWLMLRIFGVPVGFGRTCAFLCSVHAGYINGQNILMDGGSFPGTF